MQWAGSRRLAGEPFWAEVGAADAALARPSRRDLGAAEPLDFPVFVYGLDRHTPDLMRAITTRLSQRLGVHRSEKGVSDSG